MDGGRGNQTTITQQIPEWLSGAAQQYLGRAGQVAGLPYTPYEGQRVADLSPTQTSAIGGLGRVAAGIPSQHAADEMLTQTLRGGFQNPFASAGVNPGGRYEFSPLSGGTNQYIGDNPHFRQTLRSTLDDVTDAYRRGTSADTTRLFNLSGAFGGSAHQNAVRNNERELGRTLGNIANQAHQQQYDRSAGLMESQLGRGLQAGQFNLGLGRQSFEDAAGRGLQAGMFGANLGSQAHENERNRQLGAVGAATGLAGGMSQNLVNAMNAGGLEQRHFQNLLDSQYGDFREWRDYPQQQLGIFGNALAPLFGGAPRSQTTRGPGYDPVGQGMGLMMLANGFGGKGGSGGGVR